ncbi:NAD(P)H-hydrate epimerase [Blastopirellula sp. JC732]|uniref:NAD(P)H-hydrate epimerase n=1 Tax=Blastopirellula sediminis TaxID=2894196 RepID=A0A9X1MR19_9BACT|nr:NAD(P)H-hydrate epimerase [Blastopirellula sediminis]MCC9604748.1 NAD(P)H-hydrate epimerase [Blastopirellula sediminis]MCC9631953.1 NAD(P)H-hydrate epimerase [Blastopirellula sediminis]
MSNGTSLSQITRQQVRAVDRISIENFGVPGVVLMENAARGCVDILAAHGARCVRICCGKGNNGGDGLAMARLLDLRGIPTQTLLFCPPTEITGDAAVQLNIVQKAELPLVIVPADATDEALDQLLSGADWIVDALLGTGMRGNPRSPLDRVIQAINRSDAQKLAVDLPSGLDCDLGTPGEPTVEATVTATFVAPKVGFAVETAKRYLGEVVTVDIGAPRQAIERACAKE